MGETARIADHRELRVYQHARAAARRLYDLPKTFPPEEAFSLTAQARRSSRSVCANIAEAWQRRRYRGAFVARLVDAAAEANETRVWIEFARDCGFMTNTDEAALEGVYQRVIAGLVRMAARPQDWTTR